MEEEEEELKSKQECSVNIAYDDPTTFDAQLVKSVFQRRGISTSSLLSNYPHKKIKYKKVAKKRVWTLIIWLKWGGYLNGNYLIRKLNANYYFYFWIIDVL